jgi:hypothetical protein
MSSIEFVSHESFPEDQYISELVYLCLDEKYRVAYTRRNSKTGGKFWTVGSIAVTKDGVKNYYEAFLQDSTFLEKDIKTYLDKRLWEKKNVDSGFDVNLTSNENEIPF